MNYHEGLRQLIRRSARACGRPRASPKISHSAGQFVSKPADSEAGKMTAQTWDSALARARTAEHHSSHIAANIAVLTQLRERWQDSVDMLTSMFDLVMVP